MYLGKMSDSISRLHGLMRKEFVLILRDKGTIAMLVIMPIMLLILFGFAISFDPKHLPTTVVSYDHSPLTRALLSNLETSQYFKILYVTKDKTIGKTQLQDGRMSFVFTIPEDFTRQYIRGNTPSILVELDGSDPGSSASALNVVQPVLDRTLNDFAARGLDGPNIPSVETAKRSVQLVMHRLYNETNRSAFDIVPGLIGVLLTLTMVMLTSTAITSEFESGTMEMLLTTPLKPLEVILGKVIPYIVLGYVQLTSVLVFGKILVGIPIVGSLILLYLSAAPFIIASLMIGMIFSTIATTPMQAMQLSVFYQLPSMFLSGYMFSYYGMPKWAQLIGACLPMTYFIRITRGIMLKGNGLVDVLPNIVPILCITVVLIALTRWVFRTTLD